MGVKDLLISFRPKQWIKNLFVLAALIFAQKFLDKQAVVLSFLAFLAFCLVSSSVYLINDVADVEKDKIHPLKKNRPIARGSLSKSSAIWAAIILLVISIFVSLKLDAWFLVILIFYWLLNLFYSFYLKKMVILDVITVALGFVLRVIAGAVAIGVVFSSWLLLCTFFLTLFLALGKRKNELLHLSGNSTRGVLEDYSLDLLNQMNAVVLPSALLAYALYTFNSQHSQWLMLTVPVVLFGLFRYLYIIDKKNGSDNGPADDLLLDRPLQLTVLIWVLMVMVIFIKFNY